MISSPVGASAGDNGDETLSSVTVPVRSCPGTAGTPAKDVAKSKIAAIAALCRIRRFMIWNNLHSIVVVSRDMLPLSDSLDDLQHKTVDTIQDLRPVRRRPAPPARWSNSETKFTRPGRSRRCDPIKTVPRPKKNDAEILDAFPLEQTAQASTCYLVRGPGAREKSRIIGRTHAGEQRCLHYRRGNTRAQARRVTNLRSPSLRLPSERVPWCTWAESAVSRHFHANSRVSPSDP